MKVYNRIVFRLVLSCLVPAQLAIALELPTKVEIIADRQISKAASQQEIQFNFEISPNWHIYYKEPGETGLPTKINFKLPDQLRVEQVLWPTPEDFIAPGDKHCKGYSEKVSLRAKIVANTALVVGEKFPVVADLSWLNCREEMCVPQRQQFEHSVMVVE